MKAEKSIQSDNESITEEMRKIVKIVNPLIADGFALDGFVLYEKTKKIFFRTYFLSFSQAVRRSFQSVEIFK